ncbi:MAG: Cerebroside-sulfatase, partial [Spirochaetes bacterium]|nr:Cerebroside-sulfatase [Spirochaetota bacterium]
VRKGLDELYDLETDPGETQNLAASHRDVTARLDGLLQACREDLGDDLTGVNGTGRRSIGAVANPKPLTTFDPKHPYFMAMYDIGDAG